MRPHGRDDESGFLSVDAPRRPGDREGVELPELLDDLRTFPMFGMIELIPTMSYSFVVISATKRSRSGTSRSMLGASMLA